MKNWAHAYLYVVLPFLSKESKEVSNWVYMNAHVGFLPFKINGHKEKFHSETPIGNILKPFQYNVIFRENNRLRRLLRI